MRVSLSEVALLACGYVIGAKAGRERYAQIVGGLARASQQLEEFSARGAPDGQDQGARRVDRRSRPQRTRVARAPARRLRPGAPARGPAAGR